MHVLNTNTESVSESMTCEKFTKYLKRFVSCMFSKDGFVREMSPKE